MSRREYYESQRLKKIATIFGIVLIVSIIIFLVIFELYNQNLKKEAQKNMSNLRKINEIVENNDFEETSYSEDNTVSNSKKTKNIVNTTPVKSIVENKVDNTIVNMVSNEIVQNENKIEEKKELKFEAPISGEIIKDFAIDTLVYSNTLEEWTKHTGIDIKAEKMSIVVASESGIVESIKNDPRYGLTVTISHNEGFKTVYSNLLTSEFVTEGKQIEKGDTIGTVGESASFEIADETHLHFEMYKDDILVNPTIYLK